MELVVHDASTLLNLLKTGLLECAAESLQLHILVSDFVAVEIETEREIFDAACRDGWIEIRHFEKDEIDSIIEEMRSAQAKGLTLQDISVIRLAIKEKCPLFSSDGKLRKYAQTLDVKVRGELWIFDRLVDGEFLPPEVAVEKLKDMSRLGARLPRAEIAKRINLWEPL